MQIYKHLVNLLLVVLLALSASTTVSAKVASGPQNLGSGLHQAESVFNLLTCQGKTESSSTAAPECSVVPKGTAELTNLEAQNIANAQRLANDLRLQSANSPFSANGTLTQEAINNAKAVPGLGPGQLSNPAIPSGFGKYTTETFQSPAGNFQMHFYKNPTTGEVLYGLDYKAVFNSMSGVPKP